MSDSRDEHPLRQLTQGIVEGLDTLESEYPDLWILTSFAANLSHALLVSAMHTRDLNSHDALPLLLWQQMSKYQLAALLQFAARDVDAGYTLLRNATELVRDVATLGARPEAAERWHNARRDKKADRMFRFDRSDPLQAYVHDLYKFASNWGTHGHITGLSGAKPAGLAGVDDHIQVRKVSDGTRDEALAMWLLGFVPMQELCGRRFKHRGSEEFSEFFAALIEQGPQFHAAATRLRDLSQAGGTA